MQLENGENQDKRASIIQQDIDDLIQLSLGKGKRTRFFLGITGPPATGKSTFSALLATTLNKTAGKEIAVVVPMDGFHLPNTVLEKRGLRPLKGIPETFDARGFIELLERLHHDLSESIWCPTYDRELHDRVENALEVDPEKRMILVEGNYLLLDTPPWDQVRPSLDQVWYLDTPREITMKRLVQRHIDGGRNLEQALKKVEGTDLPNTSLIEKTRTYADKIVRLSDPWIQEDNDKDNKAYFK